MLSPFFAPRFGVDVSLELDIDVHEAQSRSPERTDDCEKRHEPQPLIERHAAESEKDDAAGELKANTEKMVSLTHRPARVFPMACHSGL